MVRDGSFWLLNGEGPTANGSRAFLSLFLL